MPFWRQGTFTRVPFKSGTNPVTQRYNALLKTNPFLVFGLPFITSMVLASFLLTPATAVRYERYDRKTHAIDREEAVKMGIQNLGNPDRATQDIASADAKKDKKASGKFKNKDIREEYFKLAGQAARLDDWEPVRVERKPGEPDGTF